MHEQGALAGTAMLLGVVALAAAGPSPCSDDASVLEEFPGGAVELPAPQATALRDLMQSSGDEKFRGLSRERLCCGVPHPDQGTAREDDTHRWKGEVFVLGQMGGSLRRPFHHRGDHRNPAHNFMFCKAATGDVEEVQLEYLRLGERTHGIMPASIGNLAEAHVLELRQNAFTTVAMSLHNLRALELLDLSNNNLNEAAEAVFKIFEQIGAVGNGGQSTLEKLYLHKNQLHGKLPAFGERMSSLEELRLENNKLRGPIPMGMNRLTRLEVLHMQHNKLSGDLPAELAWMESMKHLKLGANDFRGEMFELHRMTNLRTLSLEHNRLTGSIPGAQSTTSVPICVLQIVSAFLGHLFPQPLRAYSNLGHYTANPCVGGAASIDNLPELHDLDLSHNRLSGNIRIPSSPDLHSIDLSTNRLEGSVPERSLSYASHLTRINLSQNRLTGPIDSFVLGIPDPAHCTELDLGSNKFDGEIPSQLVMFSRAKVVLSNNYFRGRLPLELTKMVEDKRLVLANTRIKIPSGEL